MACTACGRMLTVGRRSFMRACRAVPTGTASLRPGTQWECARHAATMSYWTGLFVPDKYVARLVPAGGADAFVLGLFAWALGFANIYYGMAQRAIDPAVPEVKKKTSVAVSRNVAYHPELQHSIAEMMLAFDPIGPHLDSVAE